MKQYPSEGVAVRVRLTLKQDEVDLVLPHGVEPTAANLQRFFSIGPFLNAEIVSTREWTSDDFKRAD